MNREDAFTFYAVAISSFLESAVDEYVKNLSELFSGDEKFISWLNEVWIHEESTHGGLARNYIEKKWPEFNWQKAYAAYYESLPKNTTDHLRASRTLEVLSRCVTEAEATMMYRCVESYTDDPELKTLMKRMAKDEVSHYRKFRSTFTAYQAKEKKSIFSIGRTILGRSELVKGRDLVLAFRPLQKHWTQPAPFKLLSFQEFLDESGHVMGNHFPIRAAERMLFKPLSVNGFIERPLKWVLRSLLLRKYPKLNVQPSL